MPKFQAQIGRMIERLPQKAQPVARGYVEACQLDGLRWPTIKSRMIAACQLFEAAKDPGGITGEDVVRYIKGLQDGVGEGTLHLRSLHLRLFLRYLGKEALLGDYKTRRRKNRLPVDNLLIPEDIKRMVNRCTNQRDRAILMLFWDSAMRLEEIVSLNIKNVQFDQWGGIVYLPAGAQGLKTGQRRIRLVDSVPDLQQWVNMHPLKGDKDAPLFVTLKAGRNAVKQAFKRLSEGHIYHLVKQLAGDAEIEKDVSPHRFRHARLTWLAKRGFNESELRIFAGWSDDSEMPAVYLHISGADVEKKTLQVAGIEVEEGGGRETGLEPVECPRCDSMNPQDSKFCRQCSMVLTPEGMEELEAKTEGGAIKNMEENLRKLLEANQLLAPIIQALSDEEVLKKVRETGMADKIYSVEIHSQSVERAGEADSAPTPIAQLTQRYLELVGSWTGRNQKGELARPRQRLQNER